MTSFRSVHFHCRPRLHGALLRFCPLFCAIAVLGQAFVAQAADRRPAIAVRCVHYHEGAMQCVVACATVSGEDLYLLRDHQKVTAEGEKEYLLDVQLSSPTTDFTTTGPLVVVQQRSLAGFLDERGETADDNTVRRKLPVFDFVRDGQLIAVQYGADGALVWNHIVTDGTSNVWKQIKGDANVKESDQKGEILLLNDDLLAVQTAAGIEIIEIRSATKVDDLWLKRAIESILAIENISLVELYVTEDRKFVVASPQRTWGRKPRPMKTESWSLDRDQYFIVCERGDQELKPLKRPLVSAEGPYAAFSVAGELLLVDRNEVDGKDGEKLNLKSDGAMVLVDQGGEVRSRLKYGRPLDSVRRGDFYLDQSANEVVLLDHSWTDLPRAEQDLMRVAGDRAVSAIRWDIETGEYHREEVWFEDFFAMDRGTGELVPKKLESIQPLVDIK